MLQQVFRILLVCVEILLRYRQHLKRDRLGAINPRSSLDVTQVGRSVVFVWRREPIDHLRQRCAQVSAHQGRAVAITAYESLHPQPSAK